MDNAQAGKRFHKIREASVNGKIWKWRTIMNINNWLAASAGIVSGMFLQVWHLPHPFLIPAVSLWKTEALARTSIPLPDGKPDACLRWQCVTVRQGYFSGSAAAAVKQKFRQDIPILSRRSEWKKLKQTRMQQGSLDIPYFARTVANLSVWNYGYRGVPEQKERW